MSEPNEKLDLSCLDPTPDDCSLDAATAMIMDRIMQEQALTQSLWFILSDYAKWAAGMATAVAASVLFLALSTPTASNSPPVLQPEVVLLSWSEAETAPTVTEMLQVLGDVP